MFPYGNLQADANRKGVVGGAQGKDHSHAWGSNVYTSYTYRIYIKTTSGYTSPEEREQQQESDIEALRSTTTSQESDIEALQSTTTEAINSILSRVAAFETKVQTLEQDKERQRQEDVLAMNLVIKELSEITHSLSAKLGLIEK